MGCRFAALFAFNKHMFRPMFLQHLLHSRHWPSRIMLVVCLLTVPILDALAWRPNSARTGLSPTTLGAHALVGQEDGRFNPEVSTPPLNTAESGSSLIVFIAGYAGNDAAPVDSYGNLWHPQGPPVFYRGYHDRFNICAYLALQAHGGRDHRVWQAKQSHPEGEAPLIAIEARNAGRLVDATQVYPQAGLRMTSGSVTTDGPALLVALWFGDGNALQHEVVPTDGFHVIEQFTTLPPNSAVQAVTAVREVDRAGTYQVHWYAAPRQGAVLWLLAFAPSGSVTPGTTP
jgi:hypothetical protein